MNYNGQEDRPPTLSGPTQRMETGWGKVYVTINVDEEGDPFEVFITTGQSGGLFNSFAEALAKVISHDLRSGGDPEEVAEMLMSIRSDRVENDNGDRVHSIPDAVGIAIQRLLDDKLGESVRGTDGEDGEMGVED